MDPISENTNEDVIELNEDVDEGDDDVLDNQDMFNNQPVFDLDNLSTEDDNIENQIFDNTNENNETETKEDGMLSGLFNFSNIGSEITNFLENNLLVVLGGLVGLLVIVGILYKDLFLEIFPFMKTIFEQIGDTVETVSDVTENNIKET
tara:strand:- start:185 stop:631 length:447 start_codon:yes stop_codon:yes gene_type:complete